MQKPVERRTIAISRDGKREIIDPEELARLDDLAKDAKPVGEFIDEVEGVSDEERSQLEALAKQREK